MENQVESIDEYDHQQLISHLLKYSKAIIQTECNHCHAIHYIPFNIDSIYTLPMNQIKMIQNNNNKIILSFMCDNCMEQILDVDINIDELLLSINS